MKMPPWTNRFSTGVLACLLAIGCAATHAQDVGKARLLVASPSLQGPYSQTALIAVPVGGRHFGFILNRATELKLSNLFPDHAPSAKVADPVYFGGPQMIDALFAVVPRNPGEQALPLFGELYVTNRAGAIDRIIEQTPNDARYFTGFVGWEPGELENEIARGHWYVTEPEAGLIFRRDTSRMWDELVKRFGNKPKPQLQRGRGLLEARSVAGPA